MKARAQVYPASRGWISQQRKRKAYIMPTAAPMQGIHHTSGTPPVRCKNTPSTASAPVLMAAAAPLPNRRGSAST